MSDQAPAAAPEVKPAPTPAIVYPSHCVDVRELSAVIRELYLADRVRRPDEVDKYLRTRIENIMTCVATRSDKFYAIKLKLRDKTADAIYWIEFRVNIT